MKNATILLALGLLIALGTDRTFAQPGSAEAQIKAQTQNFNESDLFYNVDDATQDYKGAAFKGGDNDGTVKCWRWYYRPTYYTYYWRPVYYRPYYCYYRYWCVPCYAYCSWTTVAIYKGAENKGAVLDTEPTAGSAMQSLDLHKGDIITAIDGKPLTSLSDLKNITANSNLTVHKGNNVKFAGNLLKKTDEQYDKQFADLQKVEAGSLMNKRDVENGNYNMYQVYEKFAMPVFGVKALDNAGNGVKVTEVLAGLPGQKAGFEIGDVILEINGSKITDEKTYSDAIDCAGKNARMKVLCGKTGQTIDTDVVLNK